jgi:hypothetical protein
MSLAVLDCGSEADDLILKELLTVDMMTIECGEDYIVNPNTGVDVEAAVGLTFDNVANDHINTYELLNLDGTVFNNLEWTNLVNKCNNTEVVKINFETKLSGDDVQISSNNP